jgi:hypothetical protein
MVGTPDVSSPPSVPVLARKDRLAAAGAHAEAGGDHLGGLHSVVLVGSHEGSAAPGAASTTAIRLPQSTHAVTSGSDTSTPFLSLIGMVTGSGRARDRPVDVGRRHEPGLAGAAPSSEAVTRRAGPGGAEEPSATRPDEPRPQPWPAWDRRPVQNPVENVRIRCTASGMRWPGNERFPTTPRIRGPGSMRCTLLTCPDADARPAWAGPESAYRSRAGLARQRLRHPRAPAACRRRGSRSSASRSQVSRAQRRRFPKRACVKTGVGLLRSSCIPSCCWSLVSRERALRLDTREALLFLWSRTRENASPRVHPLTSFGVSCARVAKRRARGSN